MLTDIKPDSYVLTFELTTEKGSLSFALSYKIKVLDSIKVSSLSYKYATSKNFEVEKSKSHDFPNKVSQLKDLQEGYFFHIAVSAAFASTAANPSQVYLSLKKKGGANLFVNKYAKFNAKDKEF